MLEGWSYGLILWMTYGLGSQELKPSEFDKYARMCSACSGIGMCFALITSPFLFSIGGYFLPFIMLSGAFLIFSFIIFVTGVLDGEEKTRKINCEETVESEIEQLSSVYSMKPMPDFNFTMSIPVSIVNLTHRLSKSDVCRFFSQT
jgi:hypothetical protein